MPPPPSRAARSSRWLWTLLWVALLVAAATAFHLRVRHAMPDFGVYRQATLRVVEAEPLYRASDGHFQFKYLPAFALLVAPVTLLPDSAARAVWFGISVLLIIWILERSWRLLPGPTVPRGLALGLTLVVMAKFYGHELVLGQANLLLASLVLAAMTQWRAGQTRLSGALVGLAIVAKPYALIFVPYLLIVGRAGVAGAALAVLAALLIAPAAVYGLDGNARLLGAWFQTVASSTPPLAANPDNVSLFGLFGKWLGAGPVAGALAGLAVVGLGVVTLWILRRRDAVPSPDYLEVALLLTLIPLISPQGWDYVFLLSTPAVLLVLDRLPSQPAALRVGIVFALAAIGLTLYDVLGPTLYRTFMSWSVLTVVYLFLVGVLGALRARRLA